MGGWLFVLQPAKLRSQRHDNLAHCIAGQDQVGVRLLLLRERIALGFLLNVEIGQPFERAIRQHEGSYVFQRQGQFRHDSAAFGDELDHLGRRGLAGPVLPGVLALTGPAPGLVERRIVRRSHFGILCPCRKSAARRQAAGLDPAQSPAEHHEQEQRDRKADTHRERARHLAIAAFAVRVGPTRAQRRVT